MTKQQSEKIKKLIPLLRAIRLRCLDCSANSSYEVKKCSLIECALYDYRFGTISSSQKSPYKKTQTNENDKY